MFFKGQKGNFKIYQDFTLAFNDEGVTVNVRTGQKRKPYYNQCNGYEQVFVMHHGKYRALYVHRCVAELYVPNPNGYDYITHINGIKSDNRAANLKWISLEELNGLRRLGRIRTIKKKLEENGNKEEVHTVQSECE